MKKIAVILNSTNNIDNLQILIFLVQEIQIRFDS